MSYSCKILLDSISETNKRITTFELTYPRIIHSEFMTHRMFSRNAASSRAIPFSKLVEMVETNPFVPERFPINAKGMQPNSYIESTTSLKDYAIAKQRWIEARDSAIVSAKKLYYHSDDEYGVLNIHKQICNRLLEPFLWYTCIVTATEFSNFFKLRCDENAQYEIKRTADLMYEAYNRYNNPINDDYWNTKDNGNSISPNKEIEICKLQKLKVGEWHCPLVNEEDDKLISEHVRNNLNRLLVEYNIKCNNLAEEYAYISEISLSLKKRISVARCARVSYLTHDGKRDIEKDLELFERLRTSGHWSPFEHVCTTYYFDNIYLDEQLHNFDKKLEDGFQYSQDKKYLNIKSGNIIGWKQYRKEFQNENCTNFRKEE